MSIKVEIDIETSLPNPQMVSYDYEDVIHIATEKMTLTLPIKARKINHFSI